MKICTHIKLIKAKKNSKLKYLYIISIECIFFSSTFISLLSINICFSSKGIKKKNGIKFNTNPNNIPVITIKCRIYLGEV